MQPSSPLAAALIATGNLVLATEAMIARARFIPAAPAPAPTAPPQVGLARRDFQSCDSSLRSQYAPPVPTGAALTDIVNAEDESPGHCTITYPLSDKDAILEYATQVDNWYSSLISVKPTVDCGGVVALSITSAACPTVTYLFTDTDESSTETTSYAVPSNLPTKVVFSTASAIRADSAMILWSVIVAMVVM